MSKHKESVYYKLSGKICYKKGFICKEEALLQIRSMINKHTGPKEMGLYYCDYCDKYHMTKNETSDMYNKNRLKKLRIII